MLGGMYRSSHLLVVVLALVVCSCTPETPTQTGPMALVILSDAGENRRELSAVERARVADWLLEESVPWTEVDLPDEDAVVTISGDQFFLFIEDETLVVCGHALGCRSRPAPVAHLREVIQQ